MTARSLAEQALELAEKATPGPWRNDTYDLWAPGNQFAIARWLKTTPAGDAEFVAFARTALPALAERCLALEEALRRMVEHVPTDTLSYEQVRELGRAALALWQTLCLGFGEFEGRCCNAPGSSFLWCQRCDDLRLVSLSEQIAKIGPVQGPPTEEHA